jgi:hypothetical protein
LQTSRRLVNLGSGAGGERYWYLLPYLRDIVMPSKGGEGEGQGGRILDASSQGGLLFRSPIPFDSFKLAKPRKKKWGGRVFRLRWI